MRFANSLRARPEGLLLSTAAEAITIRVQAAEAWDAVRVTCTLDMPVARIKQAAMTALLPDVERGDDYLVKLRGALIPNEGVTLAAAGVQEASTLLLTSRRRRPIL
jgi:hypothetical protein